MYVQDHTRDKIMLAGSNQAKVQLCSLTLRKEWNRGARVRGMHVAIYAQVQAKERNKDNQSRRQGGGGEAGREDDHTAASFKILGIS